MKVCPTTAERPLVLSLHRVPNTLPSDPTLSVGYVGISPVGLIL
jgi:hypothetical protein